jgi:pyrophosphatase PpaX
MIKAVIFDVDGTLLDSFEANLMFFRDVMARAGYAPLTREQYASLYHLNMRAVIEILLPGASKNEIERVWELGRSRAVAYPLERVRMHAGAVEAIKILSKRYALGIATSRLRENIYEVPELAAPRRYFQATVAYEDTAEHKPDPAPLLLAAQRLGVASAEAAYVGDAETDLAAARAAGMKMILYGKNSIAGADAATDSFANLPEIIAVW